MAGLKLKYARFVCVAPILEAVTPTTLEDFKLVWNYGGVNPQHYVAGTTIQVEYSLDGGATFSTHYSQPFFVPATYGEIHIDGISWEIIKFRIRIFNRRCTATSNEITIDIT